MHIIFFTHQKSIGSWIIPILESFDDISSTTCVTTTDEYIYAARSVPHYSVLVGQLRVRNFFCAENVLQMQGIVPHSRVLNAPILTSELEQWATANKFDAIIDLPRNTSIAGKIVHAAFCAPETLSEISAPPVGRAIAYRDAFDEGIVQAISIGFTNIEIAEQFNFSLQTIRNRISRLLDESGATNRTHLAAMYLLTHAMNIDELNLNRWSMKHSEGSDSCANFLKPSMVTKDIRLLA